MKAKTYKAAVTNKETGKLEVITRDDYTSKKDFAHDLRVNGYAVRFISTPEKFDEDCEKYHWELERRKNVREAMKQHKASKEQDEQEVQETETNETTDETETEETVEQAAEQETMIKVYFDGETEMGCYIQNAMVVLPEDYTMNQLVTAIKNAGYTRFMLPTMKRLVDVKEEVSETETNETTAETTAEQETVEGISKMETTTGTDDSGFEYYSVKVAYEVIKDEIRSALFTSYSLALKVAKDFTDMWDGDKAIVIAVNFVIRNDRQPESERDKRVLETETAEIERRCVPYHDWGLSGYVSIEDKQIVNEDIA